MRAFTNIHGACTDFVSLESSHIVCIAKTVSKEIGTLIISMSFLLLRLYTFHSILTECRRYQPPLDTKPSFLNISIPR